MNEFINHDVVAIVATLIAMTTMIFAIKSYLSRVKRPSKLFFQPIESINIDSSFCDGFKGLDIKYNGEKILNNLLYFSGKLICIGKDIESKGNTITVKAPTGYNWINLIALDEQNNNASASVQENTQEALLSFDKFRKNKSFKINALLQECSDNSQTTKDSFINSLEFEHTINGTDDVMVITDDFSIIQALKHVTKGFLIPCVFFFLILTLLRNLFNLSYSQVTLLYLVFVSVLCTLILLIDKVKKR